MALGSPGVGKKWRLISPNIGLNLGYVLFLKLPNTPILAIFAVSIILDYADLMIVLIMVTMPIL